jgi:hypothetical protein
VVFVGLFKSGQADRRTAGYSPAMSAVGDDGNERQTVSIHDREAPQGAIAAAGQSSLA